MARRRKRFPELGGRSILPNQAPEIIRDLAKWAVATSLATGAACGGRQGAFDLGQDVPADDDRMLVIAGSDGSQGGRGGSTSQNQVDPPANAGNGGSGDVMPVAGSGGSSAPEPEPMPEPDPMPEPMPEWTPIGCNAYELPPLFEEVELTREIDYGALYTQFPGGIAQPGDSQYPAGAQRGLFRGVACRSATDDVACRSNLEASVQPSPECIDAASCPPFLITTEGDAVTRGARADFIALLGKIDNRYKAALVAAFDGYTISCPNQIGTTQLRGTETLETDAGFDLRLEWENCSPAMQQILHVASDGTLTAEPAIELAPSNCAIGRRPEGLLDAPQAQCERALGRYFASAARLEGASVYAFERLARELSALSAPADLIADAIASARDEIRHTRMVAALARRFGAEAQVAAIAELPARDALSIALENAIEGCVRETYGALLAHHQACTAADAEVRAAMQLIAEDETRHAMLSWRVARWLEPQLPKQAQQALALARAGALAQLYHELDHGLSEAEAVAIGWPSRERAVELISALGSALIQA